MGTFEARASNVQDYDTVPVYRKRWFFNLMLLLFVPVGIVIAISGDVYMKKSDQVFTYAPATRIVVSLGFGAIMLSNLVRFLS
jgi:putative effector of murein hydrolase LrgA (UPF0299 family)